VDLTSDPRHSSPNRSLLVTNMHFLSGRGMGIITTPEIAANIVRKYEFLDLEELTLPEIPLYISQELPGRRIGLFASRIIESSEVIMGSPPVIILMKDALSEPSHTPPRKTVLQLPVQTQTQTRALAKSRGGDEIDDIIQTNSITQSHDEGARRLAVVPEVVVCRLSSIVQCLLWQLLIITHSASTMTTVQICSLLSVELREFRNSPRFNLILTPQVPTTASTTKP
jgi:hypothetical protein